MARLRDIVVDSPHPASIARFWAAALDDHEIAPYPPAEMDRLRSQGIQDPEDDPTVLLVPVDHVGPRLWFQRVLEAKVVKNRIHLDLSAADPDAEIARLVGLGARVAAHHGDLVTLVDPDGNEFWLLRPTL